MDTKVEDMVSSPQTVLDYAASIQNIGGGQFTSRFSEHGRTFFASLYGAPFFAISRLAPEVLQSPSVNVLFGGPVGLMAADSGRWLSLYAKALKTTCRISCTVCSSTRPRPTKPLKPLLFQLPQPVLVKAWHTHLANSGMLPDVLVLYAAESFGEHLATVDDLARSAPRCKTLMAFQSGAEALVIQRLLRARGFETSGVLDYELSAGEPQDFEQGACWLAIAPVSPGKLTTISADQTDALRTTYLVYEGFINRSGSDASAKAIASVYGTRSAVQVGDEEIAEAVLLRSDKGIDLATGRVFSKPDDANSDESEFAWEDMQLSADLLDLAPDEKPDLAPDENRFLLMSWLGRALTEEMHRRELAEGDTVDEADEQVNDDPPPPASPEANAANPDDTTIPRVVPEAAPSQNSEQAKPRLQRSRISRGAGTVNVLALAARLGAVGKKADSAFESAKSRILAWLTNKGYANLDPTSNNHVEMPFGEVSIETDGKSVWSLRFDDRQRMEGGAFWRVEATLVGMPKPAIGLRLAQVRRTEDAPEPVSGVPTVVAKIAGEVGLQDAGVPLLNRSMSMHGEGDAKRLIQLLSKADRSQPVIVVCSTGNTKPDASVDRLAARLAGLAHVITIDGALSNAMIRTLGRERSVFGNAIRMYRPGFTIESDPFQHRVWTFGGSQLPIRVANDIAEETCAISLEVGDVDERVPSFIAIRNLLSETRIEALRKQTENIASTAEEERSRQEAIRVELESALAKYKSQSKELAQLVGQLQSELQSTRRERDTALDDVRQLRRQRDNQWAEEAVADLQIEDESYYPDNWDELDLWVEEYGDGKLELLPQAAKAARESPFKDIPFAYKALDYLVRFYVPMRTRDKDDTAAFQNSQQALAELGLELSGVGTALDDKRYKKEYRRQYDGREIVLDQHLKWGAGFDPTVIFRLYFHYDEATTKVVVGHFPTHLTNRITHSG